MFKTLQNKHVDEIYNLQISNAADFGNNIWSKEEICNLMKRTGFFSIIFLKNRRIIAFSFFLEVENYLDLYSIFVSPKYRKCGIATNLINIAVEHCKSKSLTKIILEVSEKNVKALNFYKRKKFTSFGIREKYYKSKQNYYNAILMEMKI